MTTVEHLMVCEDCDEGELTVTVVVIENDQPHCGTVFVPLATNLDDALVAAVAEAMNAPTFINLLAGNQHAYLVEQGGEFMWQAEVHLDDGSYRHGQSFADAGSRNLAVAQAAAFAFDPIAV